MDSDFSESDDDPRYDAEAALPGPGSAAAGATRAPTKRAKAAKGAGVGDLPGRASGDGNGEGQHRGADDDSGGGSGSGDDGRGTEEQQRTGGSNNRSSGGDDGAPSSGGRQEEQPRKKQKPVLTKRKLEQMQEASDRRGIVYISRIPPHMKPHKLRHLLEPFGEVGRVYCAPEDPALRRLRKKKGGNSGKNFTEGWVEFEDKRRAKRAALALNGQPMGGSKRSAYHYDLWNIKYLPKFKWDALTEEINYQRAVREQRLVAEISAAKRERDFYLSRVDKAKAIEAIQERRAKKQQQQQQPESGGGQALPGAGGAAGSDGGVGQGSALAPPARKPRLERHFGQRAAKADPVLDASAPVLADDVLGLLGRRRQ